MSEQKRYDIEADLGEIVVTVHNSHVDQIDHVQELDKALGDALAAQGGAAVVFDIAAVEYVSSGILGWLAALNERVKADRGPVQLRNVRPPIAELLHMVCLDQVFLIESSGAGGG